MTKKKIFIIIGVALAVIAVGFGIYFAVKKTKEIMTPPGAESGIPSGYFGSGVSGISTQGVSVPVISAEKKEKIQIMSDQPIFDYWTTDDFLNKNATTTATSTILSDISNQIFYFNESGQILKAVDNKDDEIISDRIIENIQSIEANKDGSLVIVKYGANNFPQFEIFDVAKKVWTVLENMSALTFSPNGNQIAYLEKTNNNSVNTNLAIKDLLGKKPKTTKIISFNQKDFNLKWLTADKILLTPKPSYQAVGEIWAVDIKKKTINFFNGDTGIMVNWAKDGSIGLKMGSNQKGEGKLNLMGNDGIIKANLDFFTLPEKCFVSLVKIYCGLSQSQTVIKNPALPDDYLKKAVYYSDYLYEIDIPTNSYSLIFSDPNFNIDFSDLSLFNNNLMFINRYDKKLYKLNL